MLEGAIDKKYQNGIFPLTDFFFRVHLFINIFINIKLAEYIERIIFPILPEIGCDSAKNVVIVV